MEPSLKKSGAPTKLKLNKPRGFWGKLSKPIIALAPMDGVTDFPFRFMAAKYGKPHLHITEFTSVEGIAAGATRALEAFRYDEGERPVLAQLFGNTPECFYQAAFVVCELDFDGIDINMGCPAKNVASKGAGAALIQTPTLAKEIIRSTQRAAQDWTNGKSIEASGLPISIIEHVRQRRRAMRLPENSTPSSRKLLPVSVKTRIGYNSIVIEEWIKHLLETEPANISIHGRTLQQMYTGQADWEAIGRGAAIIHQTSTSVLGNGDIKTLSEAHAKIQTYGVDGVLVGRATFGNPAFFKNFDQKIANGEFDKDLAVDEVKSINVDEPSLPEKITMAIEHAELHEKTFGEKLFVSMRKHLAWYCRGFNGASEVRQKLMQTNSAAEVKKILEKIPIDPQEHA